MNPNSAPLVATTAAAMSASQGASILKWIWPMIGSGTMPDDVAIALAAAVPVLLHWGYRVVASWKRSPAPIDATVAA